MSDWPEFEQAKQKKEAEKRQHSLAEQNERARKKEHLELELKRRKVLLGRIEDVFKSWDKIVKKYLQRVAEATWPNSKWNISSSYPTNIYPEGSYNIEQAPSENDKLDKEKFDNLIRETLLIWEVGWSREEVEYVGIDRESYHRVGEHYRIGISLENFLPIRIIVTGKKQLSVEPSEAELRNALLAIYEDGPDKY